MIEPINTDSTEKLQELLETIAIGINKTEEILARSQQVEVEVCQHRDAIKKDTKLVSQLTLHNERKAYEVIGVQADIEQIANVVGSTVGELGGVDALESLQKEHKNLLNTLEEIKGESQKIAQFQSEATHIEEKLTFLQERFEELKNLVSTAQAEFVHQALAQAESVRQAMLTTASSDRPANDRQDLEQEISQAIQSLKQEQHEIDNEHRQKIRALELKQQSLISLILGGVGVAGLLLIVILVIVITKK